jgi:RNA polymerase sigma factor (sigma-70 family)
VPACRPSEVSDPAHRRFEAAFEMHHRAVLAYALRRTATEADAEDAVAETFTVAWRRSDRLPEAAVALPWLYAIARRVLANQHRGAARRRRLRTLLHAETPRSAAVLQPDAPESPALEALAAMRADDQELLRLLAWEGLSQAEAGIVLGISANAVAIRLHRARRRFAGELARLKGSGTSRTLGGAEGRLPGHRRHEESA